MKGRVIASVLRLWQRDRHARSLNVTTEDLQDFRDLIDRFRNQAARIAYEGGLQSAAYDDVIAMIEKSDAAESFATLDDAETPEMTKRLVFNDDTEPLVPIPLGDDDSTPLLDPRWRRKWH